MNQQKNSIDFCEKLSSLIKGEVDCTAETLATYSHDASLFEVIPRGVVYPKDSEDICKLVEFVNQNRPHDPNLSLTARSGGTDMSGGAINDSLIVSFGQHFTHIGTVEGNEIRVQPGVYYHDLEPVTLAKHLLLPSYPASREICMVGGMVANNAGGEKSLVYGKTDRYVHELKVVLRDGETHTIRPLSAKELSAKLKEDTLEGSIYRQVSSLISQNQALLARSRPKTTKNSTGYNLWDVADNEQFDLTKLFVGSQGTLGIVTEVKFKLIPAKPLSGMVVLFLPRLEGLGGIINKLLPLKPSSLESFDEHTLKFAFRFFLSFRKTLGMKRFLLLGLSFIPVLRHLLRYLPRLPKLILLCEFEGDNQTEIDNKITHLQEVGRQLGLESQLAENKRQEEKFWIMRRESFNLLRKNVKHKHTAPFIDDIIVPAETLEEFLPKLSEILDGYGLLYTVAGHMGDGNFHIIPLMDLTDASERAKIAPVLEEVTKLVIKYGGSLSGEHNDGLIRGPFLSRMYEPKMIELFKEVKRIFDPDNIFNPHKKVTATWEYSEAHMRKKF